MVLAKVVSCDAPELAVLFESCDLFDVPDFPEWCDFLDPFDSSDLWPDPSDLFPELLLFDFSPEPLLLGWVEVEDFEDEASRQCLCPHVLHILKKFEIKIRGARKGVEEIYSNQKKISKICDRM
jgi:hypothetical protein